MSRIDLETTIPSFYYEVRSDAMNVARHQWTRLWYDSAVTTNEIVTSAAVLQELQRGEFPGKMAAIAMVTSLDALAITDEVLQIAEEYRSKTDAARSFR